MRRQMGKEAHRARVTRFETNGVEMQERVFPYYDSPFSIF